MRPFGVVAALALTAACGSSSEPTETSKRPLAASSSAPIASASPPSSGTNLPSVVPISTIPMAAAPDSVARLVIGDVDAIALTIYGVAADGTFAEIGRTDALGAGAALTDDGAYVFGLTHGMTWELRYLNVRTGAVGQINCPDDCGAAVPAGGARIAWFEGTSMIIMDLDTGQRLSELVLPPMPWPVAQGADGSRQTHGPELLAVQGDQAIAQTTGESAGGWPGELYRIHDGRAEYLGPSGNRAGSKLEFSPDGDEFRYVSGWHASAACNGENPATYDLIAHAERPHSQTPMGFTFWIRQAGFGADGSYRVTASERAAACGAAEDAVDPFVDQTWIDNGNGWEGPFDVGMSGRWTLPAIDHDEAVVVEQWGSALTVSVGGASSSIETDGQPIGLTRG